MSDNPTTIRVQPWGEGQGDYVLINAADFDPAVHTPIEAATDAGSAVVEIPDEWRDLHHNKKIALAEQIAGEFEVDDGKTRTQTAEAIIEAELAKRA